MRWCLLLVALTGGVGAAAPPAVPVVPKSVQLAVNEPTTFSVKGITGKQLGSARTYDEKALLMVRLWSNDATTQEYLLFPKRAGTYHLVFWNEGEVTGAVMQVEVTGGAIDDGVKPPPGPASFRVVFIEETSEAVGTKGAMLTDKTLDARMKERGHSWRVVDKDVVGPDGKPPADLVDLLKAAEGKYPQLFLVDKAGKRKTVQLDAPTKAADLIKILEKNGG